MPLKRQLIGRYHRLAAKIKGRKERVVELSVEVAQLWNNKLNFPSVSDQVIRTKVDKVLKVYDECVKRGKYDALNELFDMTKVDGEWLSTEDKRLYYIQLESQGKLG
jgi:hypothetical protein